ncbi:MAG: hypothetical protein GY705_29515, partial [Bacteroidetes bacterium]|nr:hypothetical protein [Bacteroidota bacterium]
RKTWESILIRYNYLAESSRLREEKFQYLVEPPAEPPKISPQYFYTEPEVNNNEAEASASAPDPPQARAQSQIDTFCPTCWQVCCECGDSSQNAWAENMANPPETETENLAGIDPGLENQNQTHNCSSENCDCEGEPVCPWERQNVNGNGNPSPAPRFDETYFVDSSEFN